MAYQDILYEVLGPVARISHNRPRQRNAENSSLLDEMDHAVRAASADPDIRVIVIAGTGDHFSSGHDIKEGAMRPDSTEARWEYETERYYGYCLRIWDAPKPTIAQVQGACIAGAFMVANMCDLVVASDDAFFGDPVAVTLAAAAVEVLVHPWVMGLRQAKELLFTGRRLGAEEALRIGMVNRVVPRAELESAVLGLAGEIAKAPPFTLKLLKRSLNRGFDMQGFRTALQAHFDTHQLSHTSDEFAAIREAGLLQTIGQGKKLVAGGG